MHGREREPERVSLRISLRLEVDRRLSDVIDDEKRTAQTRRARHPPAVQRPDSPFVVHLRQRRPGVGVRRSRHVTLRACLRGVHRVCQNSRDGTADATTHDGRRQLVRTEVIVVLHEVILRDGREAEVSSRVDGLADNTRREATHDAGGTVT